MTVLTHIWAFIVAHQLLCYYVAAVAIDQLPMPAPTSGGFYKWFYGVIQVLGANWTRGKLGVQGGKPTP
jgi:hypothetical protein